MRVLLRNFETGLYVRSGRTWTPNVNLARDFQKSFKAIEFAHKQQFAAIEVILSFDDPRFDIKLPFCLRDESACPVCGLSPGTVEAGQTPEKQKPVYVLCGRPASGPSSGV